MPKDKKELTDEEKTKLNNARRFLESLERSEQSDRGMSNGMKYLLGTLVTGALLYFGYKNFGSSFLIRDYMTPKQTQSQSQSYGQMQTQVPQSYITVNPNLPRNNPNGYSVIDTHTTTRQEGKRGGKYNYGGYSTRQSQTTHIIVPNNPAYVVPSQTTAVQTYTPKPCEKANTISFPPKPRPELEVLPTPSLLEEKVQEREY